MLTRSLPIAFLPWIALWGQAQKNAPLSVCDVLSRLEFYQGKVITIRGELIGSDEVLGLMGENCRAVVTEGYRWPTPSLINLEQPARSGSSPMRVRIEQADSEELKAAGPGAHVYVTVTGRFETRAHFEMVRRGDGKVVPFGFGHLAACPAQIVYEEIRDPVIVRAK
jgi:hypothetical protein